MNPVERVMRVMTHLNIGASLGIAAWMVWASVQLASGAWLVRPLVQPAAPGTALHHSSHHPGRAAQPCCLVPLPEGVQPAAEPDQWRSAPALVARATAAGQVR